MRLFLEYAWLIPLLPLLSFVVITLTPIRASKAASGWLASLLMIAATVIALGVGVAVAQGAVTPGHEVAAEAGLRFPPPAIVRAFRWAPAGDDASFTMGYYIDPLAAAMLVMVTITSTCIHLFSLGYMAEDARQARFFSFISLFTAAMLLMVMASNLLLLFIAWEIMGLCSYLLIGFWYDKTYPDPNQITPRQAAIKAFITTRIGDVLLMVGLVYLWTQAGSLDLGTAGGQIFDPAFLARIARAPAALGMTTATAIALLLFAGTIGKSAQFPLHVWLPDAMEGPTPVSALIHAATMVAAGVFLVARTYPIFQVGGALPVVTTIGTLTALGAALIAVAQFDIKRILAYSTVSQLGFMVAALGIGGWVAAMFHLLMHAFFKALLFLGSGSIIHGMEGVVGHDSNTAQDIRNMGGLRGHMPVTFWTYLIGAAALAGVPGFAGFWSKDEILADAFGHGQWVVLGALLLASFLTAFYMTRQVVLVFFGAFRGRHPRRATHPSEPEEVEHGRHPTPHESPATMTLPLIVLAVFAALAGFVNLPYAGYHQLAGFFRQEAGEFNPIVMTAASLIALAGIGAGWVVYRRAFATAHDRDPLQQATPAVFGALNNRLGFDELYARTLGWFAAWFARAWDLFDRQVLDRLVSGAGMLTIFLGQLNFIIDDTMLNDGADRLADGTIGSGDGVRRVETGKIQDYIALVFGGVVLIGVLFLYALH